MATTYQPSQWLIPENSNKDKVGNYSFDFDGTSDWIDIAPFDMLGGGSAMSLSLWIKAGVQADSYAGPLFNDNANYGFYQDNLANRLIFRVETSVGVVNLTSDTGFFTDTWTHIVGTYDGSDMNFYVNGSLHKTGAQTGTIDATSGSMLIGNVQGISYFDGLISEVCVFDYDLTLGNVTTLYGDATNGVGNPMGFAALPIAYYKGDRAALGDQWAVPNQVSQDYVFDWPSATLQYITLGTIGTLPTLTPTDELSVSGWVNPTTISGLKILWGCDNNSGWMTWLNGATFTAYIYTSGGWNVENSSIAAVAGEWFHVVITWKASTTTLNIYINNNSPDTNTGVADIEYFPGHEISIGRYYGSYDWDGIMSNVMFWDKELSAANVETLYNNGTPLKTGIPELSDLQGWWKLDDLTTWNTAALNSWEFPNAVITPNYTTALETDGSNGPIINIPSVNLGTTSTISFWYCSSAWDNSQSIIGSSTNQYDYLVWMQTAFSPTINHIYFWVGNPGASVDFTNTAVRDLLAIQGTWIHIALVRNGDSVELYLNGDLNETLTGVGAVNDTILDTLMAEADGVASNSVNGKMSNMAVWDSALTSGNITTIYNNGTPEETLSLSPISWWKLDNITTGIQDSGSESNNGTISGSVTQTTAYPVTTNGVSAGMTQANLVPDTVTRGTAMYSEYSFEFDGVGDKITIGNPVSLQITGAMSLSCWVNFDYGSQTVILTKDQTGGSLQVFSLWVDAWSGVGVSFAIHSGGVATSIQGVTAINDGNWHHVAATFEPSTALKVYIDGILDATNTTSIPATIDNDAADFVIGAFYNTSSFNYAGKVCEVAVWNSTLSAANVLTIFNNGRPADLTDLSPVSWWKLGNEAFWDGSNWIIRDNGSASNTGTSAGPPNLIGDAPQSFANGLSVSMDIDDRIGESGFSDSNASIV